MRSRDRVCGDKEQSTVENVQNSDESYIFLCSHNLEIPSLPGLRSHQLHYLHTFGTVLLGKELRKYRHFRRLTMSPCAEPRCTVTPLRQDHGTASEKTQPPAPEFPTRNGPKMVIAWDKAMGRFWEIQCMIQCMQCMLQSPSGIVLSQGLQVQAPHSRIEPTEARAKPLQWWHFVAVLHWKGHCFRVSYDILVEGEIVSLSHLPHCKIAGEMCTFVCRLPHVHLR